MVSDTYTLVLTVLTPDFSPCKQITFVSIPKILQHKLFFRLNQKCLWSKNGNLSRIYFFLKVLMFLLSHWQWGPKRSERFCDKSKAKYAKLHITVLTKRNPIYNVDTKSTTLTLKLVLTIVTLAGIIIEQNLYLFEGTRDSLHKTKYNAAFRRVGSIS